jgi:hypothetical protein
MYAFAAIDFILPPSKAVIATVLMPADLAYSKALIRFGEFPEAEIPTTISPIRPRT